MARTSLNMGSDRLSSLPDDLLCRILSELTTDESMRTSVLSKRWRNLWSHVPALDLEFRYFQEDDFELFEIIDRYMEFNKEGDLKTFKLIYDVSIEHMHDDFVWSLDQVVKRRVCHLTVSSRVDLDLALVRMPLSLYSCATLVDLTLHFVVFDNPESELVSLPCVKKMYLEAVKFDGDSVLETIISSSPVLEDLTVITYPEDYLEVVCVRSQSLKRFTLKSHRSKCYDPDVEIDAPRLEYMSISDFRSESFLIHSIGPSAKVDIDVGFVVDYDDPSEITMIRDFLIGISTAREMIISDRTFEVIYDYSEVEALPEFSNLYHLDAYESSWEFLPIFLGCCMNLRSLSVELDHLPKKEEIELSPVPVLSSLKSLQLKTPKKPSKMKLAAHFMKNCTALRAVLFK